MGRNQQQNDPDIARSAEDDEERQMRINRNLARFLEEQTSQSRITQQRGSYKKNKNCHQYSMNLILCQKNEGLMAFLKKP